MITSPPQEVHHDTSFCLCDRAVVWGFCGRRRQTDGSAPQRRQKELERLQGEWVVKSGARAGEKFEADDTEILEIKGVKWIFTGIEKGEIVAVDSKTDPKCFDLKSAEKGKKGQVIEGIYKIEGDNLTICIHEGKDKQRPTRFEATAEQPNTILIVLKRVKKE